MSLDYSLDPYRPQHYIVNAQTPFNAEPPLKLLSKHIITPDEVFFARNHGPIPDLNESHVVQVCGYVSKPFAFDLRYLKTHYPKVEIVAALQCAGNRRNELSKVKQVKGVTWYAGAISNGYWGGALLSHILREAGVVEQAGLHVAFESYEECEEENYFGASVPLEKVMDPKGDVILAYELNKKPLTRDRGYPLRCVVPGHIGARSVKWLKRIIVQDHESMSVFQRKDYKLIPCFVDWDRIDEYWEKIPSIQEFPVQAVICSPYNGEKIREGPCVVRGYAISGGGIPISRVEISVDGGNTWDMASLINKQKGHKSWGWVLWEKEYKLLPKKAHIICRAFDDYGNTQPEKPIWNLRGVMNNSLFSIRIETIPNSNL